MDLTYRGIGLMCGTSQDGLDVADVTFYLEGQQWKFKLNAASVIDIPENITIRLSRFETLTALELIQLDRDFAQFSSECVLRFKNSEEISFIASHGVTVFHQPSQGLTLQIGSGAVISSLTGLKTVSDFRSQNIAYGGQGAPLVPFFDKNLFKDFKFCLNLGGFANISITDKNSTIGYDVCPCNLVLNQIATKAGSAFDKNGDMARQGNLIKDLLIELNSIPYYETDPPKSLGQEWLSAYIAPIIFKHQGHKPTDLLHTLSEHIAIQIGKTLSDKKARVLITGGGAFNSYLISRIKSYSQTTVVIPDSQIVKFKEAIAFAFLGLMRLMGTPNTLQSVTGAKADISSGAVYAP